MKLILEFKSKLEHDSYCIGQTRLLERETISGVSSIKDGLPINDFSRRKSWSEMELQFVRDNYMSKKLTWIAKQLRKKPTSVYNVMHRLYERGLPRKRSKNGEIDED